MLSTATCATTTREEARAEERASEPPVTSAQMTFVKCFATNVLELEGQSAFAYTRKEESLRKLSADCCNTAMKTVGPEHGGGNFTVCKVQEQCIKSDEGFELLHDTSDELHRLKPRHKWLPWVGRCKLTPDFRS